MNTSNTPPVTKTFLNMLSSCIHDTPFADPSLSQEEWKSLAKLAKAHNVLPLIFEKASEFDNFCALEEYLQIAAQAMTIVAEQSRRTAAFLELYSLFLQADLHPIVMKGIVCRQLYGQYCDHRPSGDEDLFIHRRDFEKVRQILTQHGYRSPHQNITFDQLETLQEMNFSNKQTGLDIDLHFDMVSYGNDLRKRINESFQNAPQNSREEVIDGIPITTMSHTDQLHFLIIHAFKHFMGGGFGIRLVMDILLYIQAYGNQCDWEQLQTALKEVHADLFLTDLICIGNQHLGFHLAPLGQPVCPEELLREIVDCGVFSWVTLERRMAGQMTGAAITGKDSAQSAGLTTMRLLLFPNIDYLSSAYPQLREEPWSLPLCWWKRWMKFLTAKQSNKGKIAMESIKIGRQREKMLKKYDIL